MPAKKDPAKAALDTLNTESPQASPGLTDEEPLDPEEQALLEAGNAEAPEAAPQQQPARAPAPAPDAPPDESAKPQESTEESDEEIEKRGTAPAVVLVAERRKARAEKEKREAAEKKADELQAKWDKMNDRLLALQERQTQPKPAEQQIKPPEDPEPDKQANYTDWLEWRIRDQDRKVAEIQANQRQVGQVAQQTSQTQAIDSMERQFIASGHADYYERVNFVRDRRDRQLQLMGYADPRERAQIIQNEAAMVVAGATRAGKNPAEVLHALSDEFGYAPPAPAPAAAAVPAAAPATANGAAQITAQQKRQAASTSVTTLRNVPTDGPVTLEDLSKMDDEEYERYIEKHGGDLQQIMRG